MNRLAAHPLRTLVTLGVLAMASALGACGLKGSLDLPPSAAPPSQAQLEGQGAPPPAATETPPPKKRIFLDWLLD